MDFVNILVVDDSPIITRKLTMMLELLGYKVVKSAATGREAIAAYRTITGACSPGTSDYIANRLPKPHKEKYSIGEIISLTNGEYGSEKFEEFFCKK